MTDADGAETPTKRAVAAVHAALEGPLKRVTDAGYTVIVPARDIVTAVQRELGDDALLLPRYYERDEGQAWLLGTARHINPDTGEPPNIYVCWRTGLPNGRLLARIIEAVSSAKVTELTAALTGLEESGEPPLVQIPDGLGGTREVPAVDAIEGAELVAEFVAAPDSLPHTLRALLAACEHAVAAPASGGAR